MQDDARTGAHDIRLNLLIPFLIHTSLVQIVTSMTRVTVSYRMIELELPVGWYGAISSGFALLPIFLALPLGRWIDRGRDAHAIWLGAALTLLANFGLWLAGDSALRLLAFTVIGGVGHLCLMAGHQMFALRCSGPAARESVLGNYMVALAVGQMIGPIIVGWMAGAAAVPNTAPLFAIALAGAALAFAGAFSLPPSPPAVAASTDAAPASLGELMRMPALMIVILGSVVTVTATDLFMIYLPLLGAERSIGAAHVGLLLTTRALAAMISRLFYARLIAIFGRGALTLATMGAGALGFVTLAIPAPLWVMYAGVTLMGFGLGLAIVLCLSNVVELAPRSARGTAMTMRLTGNRIGQFALPFAAGFLGAAAGVGAILLVTAAALVGSAYAIKRIMPKNNP